MTARQDFEAKYQRSADDPSSAEMLAIWEAAWQAATERAAALAPGLATDLAIKYAGGGPVDFETIAAAIREGI